MSTNRYNQITTTKSRYNPVSSISTPDTAPSSLNPAGQKAFYGNPYANAPLPKSQATKTPAPVVSLPVDNPFLTMEQPLTNTKIANSTPFKAPQSKTLRAGVGAGMTPEQTAKAYSVITKEAQIAKEEAPLYKSSTPTLPRLFGKAAKNEDIADRIANIDAGKNVIYNSIVSKAAKSGRPITPAEAQKLKYDIASSEKITDMAVGASAGLEKSTGKLLSKTIGDTILESVKSIEIPVGPKTILTWKDLSDITRGVNVSPTKMEAFKKLTQENTNFIPELKKGNITVEGQKMPLVDYLKQSFNNFFESKGATIPKTAPEEAPSTRVTNNLFSPKENKPGVRPAEPVVSQPSLDPRLAAPAKPVANIKETPQQVSPVENSPVSTSQEIFQNASAGLPPDISSTIEPLEEVVQKGNTPFSKRALTIDDLRTPWRVFDKMGIRPAYQTLLKSYEGYVTELPKNIDKITAWSKRVPAESNEKIFRYLDGEKISLTTEESQVAKEIKDWLGQWADRLGMRPDERISEYITHIFPIDKKGVEIPEEIAALINNTVAKSVYNPFLLQRKGAEGYLKDTWRALDAYVKRATRKVNMDPALKAFEDASKTLTDVSQINYVEKFISRLNMRPTANDLKLDNQIKSLVGYTFGARPINSITRAMRQMIARAKIGGSITSFAKNLTQGVNTFGELGTKYTLKGYLSLAKPGAAAEIKANNVTMGRFIEDRTYSAVKKAAEIVDKVLFLNMEASENVNRGAAYFGAKAKFLDGKITPKEFREGLGREMPENYTPNVQDAVDYGKFIAGKTQFRFDPLETPLALSSDIARTAFQFQTFGLKQAEFILGNLSWANKWKLLRYIFSSIFIFGTIGAAFGMKWQDSYKTMRWGWPPIAQFIIDLYQGGVSGTDKYGNTLDTKERVKATGKTLFTNVVPAGAQLQRTYEGLSTVESGKETTSSGKFKYKVEPTTQNYISGALFGKYNLPEAKTYYKKQEDKKKGKAPTKSRAGRYNPI